MNIFQDPTKSTPRSDSQIVRVPFEKMDLMNSTMPTPKQAPDLSIKHVPNAGNGNGR
jgi:hypothetical protein